MRHDRIVAVGSTVIAFGLVGAFAVAAPGRAPIEPSWLPAAYLVGSVVGGTLLVVVLAFNPDLPALLGRGARRLRTRVGLWCLSWRRPPAPANDDAPARWEPRRRFLALWPGE